jgi:hypothetical protein
MIALRPSISKQEVQVIPPANSGKCEASRGANRGNILDDGRKVVVNIFTDITLREINTVVEELNFHSCTSNIVFITVLRA